MLPGSWFIFPFPFSVFLYLIKWSHHSCIDRFSPIFFQSDPFPLYQILCCRFLGFFKLVLLKLCCCSTQHSACQRGEYGVHYVNHAKCSRTLVILRGVCGGGGGWVDGVCLGVCVIYLQLRTSTRICWYKLWIHSIRGQSLVADIYIKKENFIYYSYVQIWSYGPGLDNEESGVFTPDVLG